MLDASSQIVLGLFAMAAVFALAISHIGHVFGARGAIVTVLLSWILLTALALVTLLDYEERSQLWPLIVFHTTLPLIAIFLPMLHFRDYEWLRGRLLMGLVGAVFYACVIWITIPSVLHRGAVGLGNA